MVALLCGLYLFHVEHAVHAAARRAAVVSAGAPAPAQPPAEGAVLGTMRIPALHLDVPILNGDSTASLLRGVGLIPGTVLPGGLGTVGLAGHRDTFLRKIAVIRPNTLIVLSRGDQQYSYRVDSTQIVHPEDVEVLETAPMPELVGVTCYPFHYIGAAPLRFVVKAHLLSLLPDPTR